MAGRIWTSNELLVLKKEFPIARQGIKDIISFFPNRTAYAIQIKANLLGLRNSYTGRANYYDVDFWKNYNSVNSYWGGFSAADGCIKQRKDGGFTFAVEIMEEFHLQKFVEDTKADYKIRITNLNKRKPGFALYCIQYNVGPEWVRDLEANFNIVPRKTYCMKAPVQIPKEFFPYFLVGFIDGDGCWFLDSKRNNFSLSIRQFTPNILEFTNNWIDKNFLTVRDKKRHVNKTKGGHYSLYVCGRAACELYLTLRKLIPTHHLSRKWDSPEKISFCENYLLSHKSRVI
jgi:hypothetical protein